MRRQVCYGGVRVTPEAPCLRNVQRLDSNARPMLHAMSVRGLQIDPDHFRRMDKTLTEDMERVTEEIRAVAGHYLNPGSGDQVAHFLFKELGITAPRLKFTPSGKRESVENEVLVSVQHEHPVVSKFLDYKEFEKLRGTYARPIPKLAKKIDGKYRLMPWLKDTRTPSGRYCIAKGTPIEILRDVDKQPAGVPIEHVKIGDWAYTFDENRKLTLRQVTWAGITVRNAVVVRVWWLGDGRHSDGYLDLTPNHEVRLVNGDYRRADELKPKDRVLSLSRGSDAFGYQRLWATGHEEIPKEHRFVYQTIHGECSEHIHHTNGRKADNRFENLVGMTASQHKAHHPPSEWSRIVSGRRMREYNKTKVYPKGEECPNWLGLTREWMIDILYEHGGKPTVFRDIYGIDYETAQKYMRRHNIDWKVIRRECKSGKNHQIVSVQVLSKRVDTYDLEIDGTHNFIAGGICVHNSADQPNLLAMPNRTERARELLNGFITDDGWTLISVDLSQIEPRVVAHRSQDERLLAIYHNKEDNYSDLAITAFRLKDQRYQDEQGKWQYPGVDKKKHRFPSKTCFLAWIYRVSNKGLLEQMPVLCGRCGVEAGKHDSKTCRIFEPLWNEENCQELIDATNARYPSVPSMQRMDDERARMHTMVWDLFGRLLHVTAVRSVHPWVVSAALREAGNMPIQSTAAGCLKITMSAVMDDLQPYYGDVWYPLLPVHDEIVSEVRADVAEEIAEHIAHRFRTCVQFDVPLDAEWAEAPTWGALAAKK